MGYGGVKVLVTGADGFIGSHLTEALLAAGADVRALAQYNSFGSLGNLEGLAAAKEAEVALGDVRDPFFCRKIVKGMDIVFNLAALIAIPYSYIAPQSYAETNVNGALNICEAARDTGCKVVQMSTSEVYGSARYAPMDEAHPLQPQSPYSASKIGADAMARSYYYAFDLPVVVARAFNAYGPRQSARAFIPAMIIQLLAGAKQIKTGSLTPTRDLNFVRDTCRGLMLLGQCDAAVGDVVNIGSNAEIAVGDVLKKLIALTGSEAEIVTDESRLRPEKSEVTRLWCDNAKIKALTGYAPEYDIDKGLAETVDWFRRQDLSRYKADKYNV